jgi:hypothetical protein
MPDHTEIHIDEDGPVDVDAVMRQIREYILARKAADGGTANAPPAFEGRFDPALYEHLHYATLLHDQLYLKPQVIPSRVPIVGPLLTLLKRKLHEVTLFYTDQLAQKQATVNGHVLGALNTLVRELEERSEADLSELRREVEALRERVRALEGKP